MNILIIDTATKFEIIAIQKDSTYFDCTKKIEDSHSQSIFTTIDHNLKKASIDLKDIDLIGVGIGPGSFTGIRIAISTARMLSQLLNIPIVEIDSQEIFAKSIEVENGENIIAAFEAKKQRVFAATYIKENDKIIEITKPGDYNLNDLINNCSSKKINLVGEGIQKHIDTLKINPIDKILNILENINPSGKIACMIAENKFSNNKIESSNYNKILPNYARISDAEFYRKQKLSKL